MGAFLLGHGVEFWAFWQKSLNCFWQSVDAILKEAPVARTIVWC